MIIHKEKKALVFNLRNPTKVTDLITTAIQVNEHKVAIPHRPDETRALRNMGYDVPDPMPMHYVWPKVSGRMNPFEAQVETASFITMNSRMFVLNQFGCVDADTEYLSPTGWVRIADYTGGPVAQYHPETGAAEWVTPTSFVKLPCALMLKVKTKYGVDQMLSPEHRVLLHASGNPSKRETVSAEELYARQEAWRDGLHVPKSQSRVGWTQAAIPTTFSPHPATGLEFTDAQIRLQVAVIADGHFPERTAGNYCVVRLKKQRKKDRLRRLLDAAGVEWREREQNTATAKGFTVFQFSAPARLKKFDASFWRCSLRQLGVVADEVMHWDGTFRKSGGASFSTTERESADFVQYAYCATERVARVTCVDRFRRGRTELEYVVQVRATNTPLMLAGNTGPTAHATMKWVSSTDGFKYCFEVPSTYLVLRRNGCVFATGNTGKTNSVLWAYDYLRKVRAVKRMLVVCPLSTLERTWADSVFQTFPHLEACVLYGTRERRLKLLKQAADIYLINMDGIGIIADALASRPDIDIVTIDELAEARNSGTTRWRTLNMICNRQTQRRVWGLTGAPTPNAPTDAWAQCRLVTPANPEVPKYFGRFRDMVMKKITAFKWVSRADANAVIHRVMQPAIRFSLDDCVDLPEEVIVDRDAPLTKEQAKAYKEMLTTLMTESAGGKILAVNEAVKINKLVQIACGVAYGTNGSTVILPAGPRMGVLREIIEASEGKVIVFVPLTGALESVAKELQTDYTVEIVHGGTSKNERDRIFYEFQNKKDPHIVVANARCMSHGLTLTSATTTAWFAPVHSNAVYEQANGRVRRPGQTKKSVIVHISGTDTERRMYKRLAARQSMQGILLDMIKKGGDPQTPA